MLARFSILFVLRKVITYVLLQSLNTSQASSELLKFHLIIYYGLVYICTYAILRAAN